MNTPDQMPEEQNEPMSDATSIPFPDAAGAELKDGDTFEGAIKGTISMQDGQKMLVIQSINDEPVGADMDQVEGEEPEADEYGRVSAEEALGKFMKRNPKDNQ